ncbi:MAG: glutaredoxin domain-containing protein [Microgenomates group bacterium]
MKITVYTITDCQFSQQEKEYLKSHNLSYEEKNLEQNREWLTEMLAVSNNFAGTPVTKIEKDDGTIIVLKGFTKEEFDEALGFKKEEVVQANAQVDIPQPPVTFQPSPTPQPTQTQPPEVSQPTAPSPTVTPVNQPVEPPAQNQQTSPSPQPQAPNPNDPLSSILQDLQTKANPPNQNTNLSDDQSTSSPLPNIPEPDFK